MTSICFVSQNSNCLKRQKEMPTNHDKNQSGLDLKR